jgi:hypothetical protein
MKGKARKPIKRIEGGQIYSYKVRENAWRERCKERYTYKFERNERINRRENLSLMNLGSLCTSRA